MKETTARGIGLVLGLVLFLVLALTGCSSSSSSSSVASSTSTVAPSVPTAGTTTVEAAEEEEEIIEAAATEEVIEEEEPDPWADMIVDDGVEGVFLLRDGIKYTLMMEKPIQKNEVHRIGSYVSQSGQIRFYETLGSGNDVTCCGDFDILSIAEGDKVIGVFSAIPELKVLPVNFYGYGVGVDERGEYGFYLYSEEWEYINGHSNLEMRSSNGSVIADYNNLEYGEEYALSWFEGTQYYERTGLLATNRVYHYDTVSNLSDYISIESELTKEGYVVYDTSALAPGIYRVFLYGGYIVGEGLFEIK